MSNHAPINFEALYRYNAGRMGRLPSLTKITLLLSACLALGGLPPFSPSAAAGVAAPTSRALLWPLEVPGALLSSFAEYRYDHLHAGIDISTGGRTGYKVRAAATGVIYRLKVEWRGYGRALYLRHPDGRVSVYGHLERYEEAVLHLERRVARRQSEAKTRYPGDIYLDPPIAVRRGQVIAFSGESGVGLPHLHFEVRDHDDAPIDPFAAGLRPPADRVRPVLESLTVTAASPQAFVDGVWRERTYPLTGRGGIETTADPVRIRGPFVASLSTYDPAGNGGRSGVGAVEMSIDGRMRYRFAPRSFRFDQYPESGLVFDHRGSRLGPAHFSYRLVRLPGNELAGGDLPVDGERAPEGYPGAIDLEPGPHLMEIVVGDAAGNTSRARIELRSDPTPEPRGPFGTAPEPGEVRVDFWPGF
ncbi:MAG TPA: M23 family metallopeptidase, partial [Candidatus Polarisedimenticolia bacterium]|nr:M23 family metallopeptidase [Candidatus Polarisedimenticolia bacterium]